MARPRRASDSKTGNNASNSQDELTCPECGKTFTRAASLGAHRKRAHGVSGASARRRRGRTGSRDGGTIRGGTSRQRTGRVRGRAGSSSGSGTSINRDALLQTLFPDGIPAREDVIRRANAWLDEAEKLARTK